MSVTVPFEVMHICFFVCMPLESLWCKCLSVVQISLNLSNNRLTTLPNDIGNLCSLNELFLQYNCLTRLPVSTS